MYVKQYFTEFITYFIIITLGCILFQIISHGFTAINWQNSILTGFLFSLIYSTIKILLKNKYRAK